LCSALSRNLWLSLPLMMITGFGMMQQMAASNTILQTIVEDEKRGRVMSFYTPWRFRAWRPSGVCLAGESGREELARRAR
jgi:MFS family permease